MLAREYAREGEAPLSTLGWSSACAQSFNKALEVILDHALPEFVLAMRKGP